jgi:8-oxo-dGTP pyrophosphatase MutT (NUDIX family)
MKTQNSKTHTQAESTEHSAGGCVYKTSDNQTLWLIGKHSGYHKWVLPKGLIEPGETRDQTAVREIQEELGVTAKIIGNTPVHSINYSYQAVPKKNPSSTRRVKTYQEDENFNAKADKITIQKTVDFFLLEYVGGDPKYHGWEMEAAGWFDFSQALSLLAFPDEKVALTLAQEKFLHL